MQRYCVVEGTEVRDTGTPKGRGIFATRQFAAGEVVEVAHVLFGKLGGMAGSLETYAFNWSGVRGRGSVDPDHPVIALGNGSLYNSANPANMRYEADGVEKSLRFIADRDIDAGEELTINYSADGGGTTSAHNRWFERKNIEML